MKVKKKKINNMLKVKCNVSNLKQLDKQIDFIDKMTNMKSDKNFQNFIKNKCMSTLEEIMNQLLIGGTTNDYAIDLYKSSNHIQDEKDGFIIYNNAKIAADTKHPENYPKGEFSIALAFEYGVGIVGDGTYTSDHFSPWEYNKHNYQNSWFYIPEGGEFEWARTSGYKGFEIYRNLAIKIENNISQWVREYYNMEV